MKEVGKMLGSIRSELLHEIGRYLIDGVGETIGHGARYKADFDFWIGPGRYETIAREELLHRVAFRLGREIKVFDRQPVKEGLDRAAHLAFSIDVDMIELIVLEIDAPHPGLDGARKRIHDHEPGLQHLPVIFDRVQGGHDRILFMGGIPGKDLHSYRL